MFYYLVLLVFSFLFGLLIGNPIINLIKKLNAKQTIREDGPQEHIKKKSNTPTIGGVIFLIPVFFITAFIYIWWKSFPSKEMIIVFICTFIMFATGFLDDLLKIKKKHNKGISGWAKLGIQTILAFIIFITCFESKNLFYFFWIFFVFAGTCNAYNLTDGLDGLATSISIATLLGLLVLSISFKNIETTSFITIFIGSLSAFFIFNKHPAKIFMGDTGSLAIGAAIGSIALLLKSELYLILFSFIPAIETLSVIIQVLSCKLSKRFLGTDKRVFKMTPLHHHFEITGWSEKQVVYRFLLLQIICLCLGIYIFFISYQFQA